MKIPVCYVLRNLLTRKLTTLLTAAGMAMVVFVFATVQMLDAGLNQTLVDTGSYDNVVVTRRSAGTEVQSGVDREQAAIIETQPEIAIAENGDRLVSKEVVVLVTLPKRDSGKPSNVVVRGVGDAGLTLRPQVAITAGRLFRPGSSEIVAGKNIAERFAGAGIGESVRFGLRDWSVVGVFDAGGSGFESEIWGDGEQMRQAFRRPIYSSVVAELDDARHFERFKQRIESDPRLTLEAKREPLFYAEQSALLSNFIKILGLSLSVIFSIGAIIGAMITMYSSVANRTAEIGTLRALGFQRRSILIAFLLEALLLAVIGGIAGLALASLMQLMTISTMNWQSFSELAFGFTLNPAIVMNSLSFALAMGFIGGFLPAARAARLNIVDALRAA